MIRRYTRPVRRAFTLVELMVAMGLSVLIMYIMAECSKICLDAVSLARSSGQMSTQLQGAGAIMTRDLIYSDHFLRDDTRPGGGVKLSQMRLDWLPGSGTQTYTPPKAGFFRIISPTSSVDIGADANNFPINSAVNHALHFTSILPAGDQNLFSVAVPATGGTIYRSRAAEIAYFLQDSGTRTSPGTGGVPLYNLIRRQRLVAMTPDEISSLFNARTDRDVIASNGTNLIYTAADLTNPANRLQIVPNSLPPNPAPAQPLTFGIGHPRFGEDLLLSNVLSFEVLVDWTPATTIANSNQFPRTQAQGNWDHPFDNLYYVGGNGGRNQTYQNQGVFDTWYPAPGWNVFTAMNANKLPLAVRVKQIQGTVRIFDPKTKLARQNTWKFSM